MTAPDERTQWTGSTPGPPRVQDRRERCGIRCRQNAAALHHASRSRMARSLLCAAAEREVRMSLRSSSYNIHVRIPGVEDKVMLVHGLTGAIDLVGRDIADHLRASS